MNQIIKTMKTIFRLSIYLVSVLMAVSCSSSKMAEPQQVILPLSDPKALREGSIVYLLGQFGVSPEKASAAALLGLIPYLVFALNGGIMAAYSTRFDGGLKKRGRSYR